MRVIKHFVKSFKNYNCRNFMGSEFPSLSLLQFSRKSEKIWIQIVCDCCLHDKLCQDLMWNTVFWGVIIYSRPTQPFMWCGQLWQKFCLLVGNMKFNTQHYEWITLCITVCIILPPCLFTHCVQLKV